MATLQEQIEFIIGPQVPIGTTWFDRLQVDRGKFHGRAFPAIPPLASEPSWNTYYMSHYYDLGLGMRTALERTKDPEFLTLFQKVEDSWWKQQEIDEGRKRLWLQGIVSPDPRHAGLIGLILRALDRPEMWDWINSYTRFHLDHWLLKRLTNVSLFYGVRPGAFVLAAAAVLSRVLPDSFPLQSGSVETRGAELRAQYLADVEKVAVQYYGRLQQTDGSWRWDDPDYTDSDGGQLRGIMQPFMVGLLLRGLINVHRASTNETVKTNLQNQIAKACRHLYSDGPYLTQLVPSLNVRIRGFAYFYHGGTTVNPTKYAKGDRPITWDTTNPSDVQNARQGISTVVAAFGYAYKITGDSFFKTAGDELWDAAYGETDKIRNYVAGDSKSYNQNYSFAPPYLAWAGGVSVPEPQPQPSPTEPIPAPTPSPAPIPPTTSVPVATVSSPSAGAKVSGVVTITAAAEDPAGISAVYLVVDGAVRAEDRTAPYGFTLDTTRLTDGEHSIYVRAWNTEGRPGDSNPPLTIVVANAPSPAPTPTPEPEPIPPTPVPTPACSISAPESITIPRNTAGTIAVTLQDVSGQTEVKVLGSDGQVTISPSLWTAGPTSTVKQFSVRVKNKKEVRVITFQSPCGEAVVKVNVI